MFLKKDNDELVVLDPDWLGAEVIGRLMCEESLSQLPHDGRLSVDQLHAAIPASPPLEMARLFATMYLCAPLHPELNNDVVFPCLDRSEEPPLKRPVVNSFEQTSDKVNIISTFKVKGKCLSTRWLMNRKEVCDSVCESACRRVKGYHFENSLYCLM